MTMPPDPDPLDQVRRTRWQLILAAHTASILAANPDPHCQNQAEALAFLYDREYNLRNVRPGGGARFRPTPATTGPSPSTPVPSQPSASGPANPDLASGAPHPQGGLPPQDAAEHLDRTVLSRDSELPSQNQPGQANADPPASVHLAPQPTADAETDPRDCDQDDAAGTGAGEQSQPCADAGVGPGNREQGNAAKTEVGGRSPAPPSDQAGPVGPQARAGQPEKSRSGGTPDPQATDAQQTPAHGSAPDAQATDARQTPAHGSELDPWLGRGPTAVRPNHGSSLVPPLTRDGGLGPSQLTVPEWINAIHELFPRKTIERLEQDALERYQLEELVTNPDLLNRAKPSQTLLKAVLRTKHLMNQEVLAMARHLVQQVIDALLLELAHELQSPFLGAINRHHRSFLKIAKNFDPETTIRNNLSTYDPETKKLYIKTPYFYSRIRRQMDRWQLIILVDESGSMLDSVIHAAVTASIFYRLQQIRTHLCIFDTTVVDLTDRCCDPIETLMQVQLGGGTDIGQALSYATTLITEPRMAIVILISDFFEGAAVDFLYRVTTHLVESGATLLGLAALDAEANPHYNHDVAQELVNRGAHVGAMTPGELAEWLAQKIR